MDIHAVEVFHIKIRPLDYIEILKKYIYDHNWITLICILLTMRSLNCKVMYLFTSFAIIHIHYVINVLEGMFC